MISCGSGPAREQPAPTQPPILGAREHNLQGLSVEIPLGRLVCLTGVSGSGKSTLMHDVLYRAACKQLGQRHRDARRPRRRDGPGARAGCRHGGPEPHRQDHPLHPGHLCGRLRRHPRTLHRRAAGPGAGYTLGTFSFNAGTGRCPTCSGNGFEHIEMQFLSDVYLRCPECRRQALPPRDSRRAHQRRRARTPHDARDDGIGGPGLLRRGRPCWHVCAAADVGLEYLQLGQPVPTLSPAARLSA
jgi:excinuclease ABC subunit A